MSYYVREDLQPDILASAVEGCDVACTSDKGGAEYTALDKKSVHPLSAENFGHDTLGVVNAVALGLLSKLLSTSNVFAISGIIGHPLMATSKRIEKPN